MEAGVQGVGTVSVQMGEESRTQISPHHCLAGDPIRSSTSGNESLVPLQQQSYPGTVHLVRPIWYQLEPHCFLNPIPCLWSRLVFKTLEQTTGFLFPVFSTVHIQGTQYKHMQYVWALGEIISMGLRHMMIRYTRPGI